MLGLTVGFGKRLNWPDDYFTFTAELGYNWYYLKNWEYLYYICLLYTSDAADEY